VYYLYRFYDPQNGRWLSSDPIGEDGGINLYGYVTNDVVNDVDPWGLATMTIRLKRNITGYIAVYGEIEVTIDDPKVAKECGAPFNLMTLETVGAPLVPPGTYNPIFSPENSWDSKKGFTSIKGKYFDGLGQYWTPDNATLPEKPENMSQSDYEDIINRELRMTGSPLDGRNIHFGPTTNHSTGCALVGTEYVSTSYRVSGDRFGDIKDNIYKAYGFNVQDSINKQFKLFAAINCAKKKGVNVKVVVENHAPPLDPTSVSKPKPIR